MPKWVDLAQAGWRLWRLLDWRPIRQQAETPLRVALLGGGAAAEPVLRLLAGVPGISRGPLEPLPESARPDLVLLVPPNPTESLSIAPRVAQDCMERELACLVLLPPDAVAVPAGVDYVIVDPAAPDLDEQLAAALIEALPEERRVAAARRAPALREPLAHRLIQEVAFANAQFALVTNLPTLLPGVGTAAGIGADLLILTTNQIVLVYRMAALWGEPLGDPRALLVEVSPVVGGAFLWRTAARALIGLLPTFAALAPKVGVAYLGTYLVGARASAYYAHGLRPSEAQIREVEAEARQALAGVSPRLRPAHAPAVPAASDPHEPVVPAIPPPRAGDLPPTAPSAPAASPPAPPS
jgi:hypothetical protein